MEGCGELEGEILGGARIAGARDGNSVEFSVSLRPEGQGLGLARQALETVLRAAKEMGYTRVWGSIHASNGPMLHLAESMSFHLRRDPDDAALMVAETAPFNEAPETSRQVSVLAVIIGVRGFFIASEKIPSAMKTPIQLVEQIIRAKTALHLRLAADRNGGKLEIGGRQIDDMIAEVDSGIESYEQILVLFKNEAAAEVMMASVHMDSDEG